MTVRVCLSTANTLTYPQGGHLWVFINWALGFKASGCEVVWLDVAPPTMSSTELSERLLTLKTLLRPFGLDHIAVDYLTENDCSVALQREGLPAISDFGVFDLLFDLRYNLPSRIALQAKRSVLLDIDPGQLQLALAGGHYPAPKHNCFFTIGQSLAGSEAGLPTGKGKWLHTNPCVYLPEWPKCATGREAAWTTISHWWGNYMVDGTGQMFSDSKRDGFRPYMNIPSKVAAKFVLAVNLAGQFEEQASPSAEDRLPKSLCFAESDVIIFVVRASGVHELGYGHKWDWEA